MQVGHIRENGYEGVYFEDDEGNTLGIERADSFDDDDVQTVTHNFDVPEEVAAQL